MKRLVLFDLDGTILTGMSSGTSFAWLLLKSGKLGFKQFLAAAMFLPRWASRYHWQVFIKDKAYLAGLSVREVTELAEKFVAARLLQEIRPELVARIKAHQAAGDIVVLLTGTHEFVAKPIAAHLGITHVEAAQYVQKEGRFTAEPPIQHPFAREKLVVAERLCAQYQMQLSDCVAYGNSINDHFLLSVVGEAVAVFPDYRLRRLALENQWEII